MNEVTIEKQVIIHCDDYGYRLRPFEPEHNRPEDWSIIVEYTETFEAWEERMILTPEAAKGFIEALSLIGKQS